MMKREVEFGAVYREVRVVHPKSVGRPVELTALYRLLHRFCWIVSQSTRERGLSRT